MWTTVLPRDDKNTILINPGILFTGITPVEHLKWRKHLQPYPLTSEIVVTSSGILESPLLSRIQYNKYSGIININATDALKSTNGFSAYHHLLMIQERKESTVTKCPIINMCLAWALYHRWTRLPCFFSFCGSDVPAVVGSASWWKQHVKIK